MFLPDPGALDSRMHTLPEKRHRQTDPCPAIRGNSISVSSNLPPLSTVLFVAALSNRKKQLVKVCLTTLKQTIRADTTQQKPEHSYKQRA